eukprot:Lankesteria_metandrocarpae@DN9590_c0_g1_i1.p1
METCVEFNLFFDSRHPNYFSGSMTKYLRIFCGLSAGILAGCFFNRKTPNATRQWFSAGMIPMYYINLEHSTHRRKQMELTFGSAGVLIRVPAVSNTLEDIRDAFDIDLRSVQRFCEAQGGSCEEVVRSASHYRALTSAFADEAEVALILEDDASVVLAPFWTNTLEDVVVEARVGSKNWKIIRLEYRLNHNFQRIFSHWCAKPYRLYVGNQPQIYGSVAYLISRPAIKIILEKMSAGHDKKHFDCSRRQRGTTCIPEQWLFRAFSHDEVLLKVPPMFTSQLHEARRNDNYESIHRLDLHHKNDSINEQSLADSFRLAIENFDYWASERTGQPSYRHPSRWVVGQTVKRQTNPMY